MSSMSRRRPMSMSNVNRANTSRSSHHGKSSGSSRSSKSAEEYSPPRVFIKPKTEASSTKLTRRASYIAVSTRQLGNTRQFLAAASKPAPRRSSSLHHTAGGNSCDAPVSRLPRSSSLARPVSTKRVASRRVGGDTGLSDQTPTSRTDNPAAMKPRKALSQNDKENEPTPRVPLSSEMHSKSNRVFIRKQSPLVPDDLRISLPSPRKAFLLPKIDERVSKPQAGALLPRRSSVYSVAPRREKQEYSVKKKNISLSSLPSIVIKHTPKSATSKQLRSDDARSITSSKTRQEETTPLLNPSPRPFLLPRKADERPLLPSLSSIASLPTQVLKHTPLSGQYPGSPSDSPCLSKARTKTIWTMLDEMKLVRSGGLLLNTDTLAPDSQARIVPLCKRLRSGICASNSMKDAILERTPVRSSSTPFHMLVSSARRARIESPIAMPPLPSLTRGLAHVIPEWEDKDKPVASPEKINNSANCSWTVVDVKNPQRRSTVTTAVSGGYGVCIRTHDTNLKPSLLTRAQTFVRFKFSGSRRVVGRGDPKWT